MWYQGFPMKKSGVRMSAQIASLSSPPQKAMDRMARTPITRRMVVNFTSILLSIPYTKNGNTLVSVVANDSISLFLILRTKGGNIQLMSAACKNIK